MPEPKSRKAQVETILAVRRAGPAEVASWELSKRWSFQWLPSEGTQLVLFSYEGEPLSIKVERVVPGDGVNRPRVFAVAPFTAEAALLSKGFSPVR